MDDEVWAIEQAMRAAQARLGLIGAYLSLIEWGAVSPSSPLQTGDDWVASALRMIAVLREHSRAVAQTYYQLARAIDSGYTLGMPEGVDNEDDVTLALLRERFADAVIGVANLGTGHHTGASPDSVWLDRLLQDADIDGRDANARSINLGATDMSGVLDDLFAGFRQNNTVVGVDRYLWPINWTAEQIAAAYEDMLRREALEAQAIKAKVHEGNLELTHDEYLARIESDHHLSGSRGAGVADWASVSAGRQIITQAGRRDPRLKAVGRGVGPNPCAWCSMLASRGYSYVSEGTAGFSDDGVSKWHLNCHCFPIVRWIISAGLPPQNKFFKDQWPVVTKGYSGRAALNKWRRWLAEQRRKNK